ncbi:MAG: ParB/RepB/Spo0J family partition protein [Patescibacteria group bacterium]|nr:ParB/RepB/Spo0J family partition protein [Patescibacteria group bacterium]MDE1988096.1 ParB/RepB/Spo0J family partition protein [Patescibacteria group bacterium]MDE2218201.1 ParB/RepB/Spo0J family partition protein [Patescibacteria group bacterium]
MNQFYSNSIFWIEVEKVKPNPYQPRHEFDESKLRDLADSIRQYGILQPLVVTRKEIYKEDGGLSVEYELISGERRLRASKIAGLSQVPVIIRNAEEDGKLKLELAIIENLQREDLNPVDRARAFQRLVDEFNFKHIEIGQKVGKSREYVSNTLRILALPEVMLGALSEGRISEGHTRPLLMLIEKPEEQDVLFKEIIYKKMTVREAESAARKIASDRIRKKEYIPDPEIAELEGKLTQSLGTRVQIEKQENGGKIRIDFFSNEDLRAILDLLESNKRKSSSEMLEKHIARMTGQKQQGQKSTEVAESKTEEIVSAEPAALIDDRPKEDIEAQENEDLYSVKNFSI